MVKDDMQGFKNDVDGWIKQINADLSTVQLKVLDMPAILDEHEGNINHNYELIVDVKKSLEDLKEEIRELKLMQLISLKSRPLKEIKYSD